VLVDVSGSTGSCSSCFSFFAAVSGFGFPAGLAAPGLVGAAGAGGDAAGGVSDLGLIVSLAGGVSGAGAFGSSPRASTLSATSSAQAQTAWETIFCIGERISPPDQEFTPKLYHAESER
jgi:hypothetical protein